jgi:hypothetical protein
MQDTQGDALAEQSPMMKGSLLGIIAMTSLLQQAPKLPSPLVRVDTTEIAILRSQLVEAKAFRSDLLQTVNMTLATISGLGVLLVTFSWFANFKLLERDKVALKKELEDASASAQTDLRKSIAANIAEEIAVARKGAEQVVVSRAVVTEGIVQQLNERFLVLERSFVDVTTRQAFDRYVGEARHWQLQRRPVEEEKLYREALAAAQRLSDDYAISTALSNLIRLGESGTLPNWSFVPSIMRGLDDLPPRFTIEKQQYIGLLSGVRRD